MTIQQLEYIVAVDDYRHFVRAAESCGVTQPTLSSMIHKLEEELDVTIFDRNTHPVTPTQAGEPVIRQARVVLYNIGQLKEQVALNRQELAGTLKMGIIPTVAPYILPRFFSLFRDEYTSVSLNVSEMRTSVIIERLLNARIDMALLATPLSHEELLEVPCYYEHFLLYASQGAVWDDLQTVDPANMPTEHLWILEEGHCLRGQVFNFCHSGLVNQSYSTHYEAGNIDTLIKIVDENGGYTIIPELHVPLLSDEQRKNVRSFSRPEPVREISLVVRKDFVREGLLNAVASTIRRVIPGPMLDSRLKKYAIRL